MVRSLAVVSLAAAAALACLLPSRVAADDAPKAAPAAQGAKAAPAKDLDGILAELSKRLGTIRTLRCRFEQKKYLEVFEDVVTSEGTLALAMPDKLRWEYVKPVKSVLTVNGRQAQRERTSRKGETTRKRSSLDDEPITSITAEQVFLWARGDFAKARGSYDLALVTLSPLVVRATPRDERVRNVVTSIDLTFSDDRTVLTGVTLLEKNKARTDLAFLDVEIDPSLPDTLFRFDR